MPLNKRKTKSALQENIAKLIREGYQQKQAVAIAYSERKHTKKKKGG